MQHVGRVDVLESAQDLIEEVARVVVAQLLSLEQLVHVRLHQTLDDVAVPRRRSHGRMVKESNQALLRLSRFKTSFY